jgi:hypothetical protein
MLPFKLIYHQRYDLNLGAHVFPSQKYRMIHDQLLADGIAVPEDFLAPEPAGDEDILRVHSADYTQAEERDAELWGGFADGDSILEGTRGSGVAGRGRIDPGGPARACGRLGGEYPYREDQLGGLKLTMRGEWRILCAFTSERYWRLGMRLVLVVDTGRHG